MSDESQTSATAPAGLIVVLGYENSSAGELAAESEWRCERALELWRVSSWPVASTGGFGAHFNTTERPHWQYTRDYLGALGLPEKAWFGGVDSRSTIEDAVLLRPLVERRGIKALQIITSDFHLPRACFVFCAVFNDVALEFIGTRSRVETRTRHAAHEAKRLQDMLREGVPGA